MVCARIDPGKSFRLVINCGRFVANLDYGMLEMAEQEHELWIDGTIGYNLDKFIQDMSALMIWGTSQTPNVWSVDVDSAAKWKVRTNEHFEKMIKARWSARVAKLYVEIVEKEGYQTGQSSAGSKAASGLTSQADGNGASCSSPPAPSPPPPDLPPIDWDTLIIMPEPDKDGEPNVLVDEENLFVVMGFKAADDRAELERKKGPAIPVIPPEIQQDMREAKIHVDDTNPDEPEVDWDRDDPDVDVGAVYPCMRDFRLAVRQHAIVHEFELGTAKSDKQRFRGFCKANGCPWVIRAKTQADNSVRVQINTVVHNCASTSRVLGKMASQAWVAERAIPLLKKKSSMGA